VPARSVFLDTSFIVALENRDDAHHERAKELDRELVNQNATLHLHLGVVYEIADGYARFGRRHKGIELVSRLCQEADENPRRCLGLACFGPLGQIVGH